MDGKSIKDLDQLISDNIGKRVKVLVKVIGGEPDEVVTGEIKEIYDTHDKPVLRMTNVRFDRSANTYNIALDVIHEIEFLNGETSSFKKAAPS